MVLKPNQTEFPNIYIYIAKTAGLTFPAVRMCQM